MRLVTALIFLATILIADNSSSYAQSDSEDVKVVIAAYHAALGALDAGKMDPLWAHDDTVMLVEPFDKVISVGWDAVKKTFDKEFGQLAELKVTQADGPHIQVRGNVAWYTGMTNASVEFKEGPSVENAPTFETGLFEKRDGHWFLVSHTAFQAVSPARPGWIIRLLGSGMACNSDAVHPSGSAAQAVPISSAGKVGAGYHKCSPVCLVSPSRLYLRVLRFTSTSQKTRPG